MKRLSARVLVILALASLLPAQSTSSGSLPDKMQAEYWHRIVLLQAITPVFQERQRGVDEVVERMRDYCEKVLRKSFSIQSDGTPMCADKPKAKSTAKPK